MNNNIDRTFTDGVYSLRQEYNSFIGSRGVRRTRGVEWAAAEIEKIKDRLVDYKSNELLLHNVGWETYIGFGLYSGIINLSRDSTNDELQKISYTLNILLNDIIQFTSIGQIISFGVLLEKTEEISFARIDNMANIFIFPIDVEGLFEELDNTAYAF